MEATAILRSFPFLALRHLKIMSLAPPQARSHLHQTLPKKDKDLGRDVRKSISE